MLLLAFHIFLMFCAFHWFGKFLPYIYGGTILFTASMVLYLLNSRMDASVKLTRMMVILLLPVFGALLFWYTRNDLGHRTLKKRMNWLIDQIRESIHQSDEEMKKMNVEAPAVVALDRYLGRTGCYPTFAPDNAAAGGLAWTHYASLLDSGVKIYEYTPGFVHSKVFVSDDREAVVGTINMDYRSLYHHFECAAYLWETAWITEIEQDFQKTLSKCSVITLQFRRNVKLSRKVMGILLKAFAPLM